MADRGRDLRIGILSDASKFDLSGPADDLDKVGSAAKDMGTDADKATDELKRLAAQGKDAEAELKRLNSEAKGNDLDRLSKDAKDAAAKVDSAFEKIAKSSKSSMTKVDHNAKDAGEGLGEFKDEANSTTKEVAASFGSVEDALGGVQEVAANAFAGFGPAGAAAGAAAAIGIGFLSSALQKSADEANATKDRVIGLAQAIDQAGGNLDAVDVEGLMRDWNSEIADNKSWWELWQESNTTNLEKFSKQAKDSGLDVQDFMRGISGLDAVAAKTSLDEINQKLEEHRRATNESRDATNSLTDQQGAFKTQTQDVVIGIDTETRSLTDAKDALLKKQGLTEDAIALAALQQEAVGRTAKAEEDAKAALEGHASAYEAFADPISAYTDLLATKQAKEQESAQATADATKSEKDSWEDYAKSVDVSVGEYLASLEKQVAAQEAWAGNLQTLAKRGVEDGVLAELEKMGPQGAPLVAKLTKASDKELTQMVSLYGRRGASAGQAVASNLVAQSAKVSASAAELRNRAAAELAQHITIPVRLGDITNEMQLTLLRAQEYANKHPVYAKVGTTAKGHERDVG